MSIHNLLPEKIISKAPNALTWVAQTLFAAVLPDVYQKMPQHLVLVYLGLTPANLKRVKYFIPVLIATLSCYGQQMVSNINPQIVNSEKGLKCCMGS